MITINHGISYTDSGFRKILQIKLSLKDLPEISSSYQELFFPAAMSSGDIMVCVRRGFGDSYFSFGIVDNSLTAKIKQLLD